ncbi:hypothetical protein FEM48_Zijuj12G0066000 [Ziziphus jujuba var. spinosa]|uniref:TF-B3 domain-containing protein n=1 Tax=Ziziphus jujuba var. spinosa TaxID=714518 RepID=A0A978UBR3_ZIZJJ|nr:hypothetical protein FEM48_Zijuj12G0066000 [Ziziphus jujuba var. spinosa]
MPINHFSSDLPETHWWTQQQQPSVMDNNTPSSKPHYLPPHHPLYHSNINNPSQQHYYQSSNWHNSNNPQHSTSIPMYHTPNNNLNFNLNNQLDYNDEDVDDQIADSATELNNNQNQDQYQQDHLEKEPMFEKPLTPSDVGKLNRLVIPKQHAEKYFPLGGGGGGDSVDKGLLLSFEDELGKFWRFRYSYWNSSQSYVLTKGWSRYVKEKRLDAGDVVLFERHRTDSERLFIGWRRRTVPDSGGTVAQVNGGESAGGWTRMLYSAHPYPTHPHHHHHAVPYQPDCLHAGSPAQNQTTPVGNSRILRLFGVNMECQPDDSEPSTPDGSSLSTHGPSHQQFYPPYHSDHMVRHPFFIIIYIYIFNLLLFKLD